MTDPFDPFSTGPDHDVETLLTEGIADMRGGDRASARIKFERVVELDDRNEKGWFWLASVLDTDLERHAALEQVLLLNPNNERARKVMDALETRMAQAQAAAAATQEVVPGVSRRQLLMLLGVAGAVIVAALVLIVVLIGVNTGNANLSGTQAALNGLATIGAQTQAVQAATQASADATATQLMIATPTIARPTLPPTWTLTPPPTAEPTAALLSPPEGVTGLLGAWGGRDLENIGYLPVGVFNLNAGLSFQRVGESLGRDVSIYANGQRIAYTLYDRIFFSTNLQAVNVNGASVENFGERFTSTEVIEPEMPAYSPDGTMLVFVARTPASGEGRQIFILSLVDYSLRNLTNDEVDYSYPQVSPNSRRVVAVRNDIATGSGVDLSMIDIASGGKFALTTDQNAIEERHPRWSPDGAQIVYAAALATAPGNHDLMLRNADGTGSASALVTSPADDIYPVLSPDARFVAFASNRAGHYEILIFDLQRQTLSQLTNNPEETYFPGDWWGP